ncbi:MAG: aldehyde ferredoxin oxidoreductase family protein [Spirochaetales bacterium]|nr:aldehyde ferredoxin oxidoreductase family protein [Spirochaetales bacterium]MCF7939829.1 aldehyde ferredoxin oxidoreductase family protein [Spirochaetales bacterium]
MKSIRGYAGKYARINLTSRSVSTETLPDEYIEDYLGGSGFGTKLLCDEVGPETGPLSPENRLIFATGVLSGTSWPSSGRLAVIARSPLTGIYGDANAGGHFTPELKFAGWDMLVFEGKADRPVYLLITDDAIEVRDAGFLWGLDTPKTETAVREHLENEGVQGAGKVKVASIGPAGENLVRFSAIQVTHGRSVARAGMGAVMGSKNLKAVAVISSKRRLSIAEPEAFKTASKQAHRKVKANRFTEGESKYGTPLITKIVNEIGRFPTKNFQAGSCDYIDDISGETLHERFFVRNDACFGCPIGCDKVFAVKEGEFAGAETASLEYEALNSLGSRCGNNNLESIIKGNEICDSLGMDVISAGAMVAFAMELYEKGLLAEEETDGLDLNWGNYHSMLKLLEAMAYRRGKLGDLLADGVRMAAEKVGNGAAYYAMHVKGMEISAQDGRAQQSMGLAHVTSSRGADHLKAYPVLDETGFPEEAGERFGEELLPELVDGMSLKYKPMYVKQSEDFAAVVDSLGICKFGTMFPPALYWEELAEAISLATGKEMTIERLKEIGERINALQRCFNIRCGISRKDDTLPERLLKEKSPSSRAKGHVVYLQPMLEEYYEVRGWNPVTGYPFPATLSRLGLDFTLPLIENAPDPPGLSAAESTVGASE